MKFKFWEKPTKTEQTVRVVKKGLEWLIGKPEPKKWWELRK